MSQSINEYRPSVVGEDVDMTTGYKSAEKIIYKLKDILNNPRKNREMYDTLYDALQKNKPYVPYADMKVEVLPNNFIRVFFYLINIAPNGRKSALGSFGASKPSPFKSRTTNIRIGLYGVEGQRFIDNECMNTYEQVLDHEIYHLYQTLSIAIRYNKQKKANLSDDKLLKLANKVQTSKKHQGTSSILRKGNVDINGTIEQKILARIEYLSNSAEIGSNAQQLLKQLIKFYGVDAIEHIGNHILMNKPTLKDIDDAITFDRNFKSAIWADLTSLQQNEQKYFKIYRVEDTEAYKLKEKILQTVYNIYKSHYKRRR